MESLNDSRVDPNRAVDRLPDVAQAQSLDDLFERFVEDGAGNLQLACAQDGAVADMHHE